jgi:hypothetical protein
MLSSKRIFAHFAHRRQKAGRTVIQRKELIKAAILMLFIAAAVITVAPGPFVFGQGRDIPGIPIFIADLTELSRKYPLGCEP